MSRTIVIGDVHGCSVELTELCKRLRVAADDRVYMVGDLMVRGPDPAGVISLLRDVGAESVRGNHEHRLLRYRALKQGSVSDPSPADHRLLNNRWLNATAAQLDEASWAFIEGLPLWLDLPDHNLRIVHAGLAPGLPIERQAERTLLYIRSLDADGEPSEMRDAGDSWAASYPGPIHVVFGHNAAELPQIHRWATGIDTACVYGGSLTALVLEAGQAVPTVADRPSALVSVPAKKRYFPPG